MTGKWHVGFARPEALPTARGWDQAYNFYSGGMDYYEKAQGAGANRFFDIHAMGEPDRDERHVSNDFYSGTLWQERAEKIILDHAQSGVDAPLFLYHRR